MPNRAVRILIITSIVLGGTTFVRADSITLRNGSIITGVVKQIADGYDVTLEDGKHRFVSNDDVKSVKLSNEGKVTEGTARERLLSLQRSVDAERDIDRIIDRYQQFITMVAGTEAAKSAQADLDQWRDRKAKGMIRVGHQWMTPADRDAMLVTAAKTVDQVCALLEAEKFEDATAMLRDASANDPDNISFLYLNGVLELRRDQLFEAKRSFDAVLERVPDHPPTLLNLSLLAVQFKRWPQAVTQLDQAMTLAPGSQEILDNVLEFLQLAPEATRRTGGFEKLAKQFAPLEAAMEERQARRGLYRFGSKWVDKAALDQAKADLDTYEKKKADLEKDYQDAQDTQRKNNDQIQFLQRMIARIESESVVQDSSGNVIRRAYPQSYYDCQRDLSLLEGQQKAVVDHIADLHKQADAMKGAEPKPPFAGKLAPIDQRGVPIILPASATQPTSQPTSQATSQATSQPASKPSTQSTTQNAPPAKT